MVFTADPENIRAVLATQFGDYGKGEPFHEDWNDFLGDGIFTTDGQQWSESRNLLRPLFIKTRVRDFDIFERHSEKLISMIGGQGQEVDISDLFYRQVRPVLRGRNAKFLSALMSDLDIPWTQ